MGRSRPAKIALLLIFVGALALRVPDLGNRPMHADESVHAVKFNDLWQRGVYRYDPDEYHGPTLYYAALPSASAHGRKDFGDLRESDLRLAPAIIGAAMILLLALAADGLGWAAALAAALLLAASPAFVFYSRYFIQEVLLAFFTLGAIVSGWRASRSRILVWPICTGLFIGLMIATKETAVLAFAAALPAWLVARRGTKDDGRRTTDDRRRTTDVTAPDVILKGSAFDVPASRPWRLPTAAAATALLTAALVLTNGLRNPAAIVDYFRSYAPWFGRAHSSDMHVHPWNYYLSLLSWNSSQGGPIWTEALILLFALLGLIVAAWPGRFRIPPERRPFIRFVAVYTLVLTVIYSAIPYKTPWNVLSSLTGMAILAGIGIAAATERRAGSPSRLDHFAKGTFALIAARSAAILVFLLGASHLALQAYRAAFVFPTGGGNPYAYAQTVPDVLEAARRVEEISGASREGLGMPVAVVASDGYYWPLPWYLRRLPNIGYWTQVPKDAPFPVVIASSDLDEALAERLQATHVMTGFFGLRTGVVYETWVRFELWEKYLKTR